MQLRSKLYIQPLIRPKTPLSLPHSKNLIAGGWRILPHPNRIGLNHDRCDWKPTSVSQRWSIFQTDQLELFGYLQTNASPAGANSWRLFKRKKQCHELFSTCKLYASRTNWKRIAKLRLSCNLNFKWTSPVIYPSKDRLKIETNWKRNAKLRLSCNLHFKWTSPVVFIYQRTA